jgi:PAS domain S-box-containing protein
MAIVGMTAPGGDKRTSAPVPLGRKAGSRGLVDKRPAAAVRESAVAAAAPGLPLVLAGGLVAAGSVLVEVLHLPMTGLFALSGLGLAAFGAAMRRQPAASQPATDSLVTGKVDELAAKLDEGIERLRDVQWELRDSDVRYRDLLDNQVDVILRRDRRGRISFVNDAFCKTFGVDQNTIIGTPFELKVLAGDPTPAIDEASAGQRRHYEQEIATLKGRRWFLFEELVIRDEQGEPREAHVVGRDVTEEKKAAQELQEARDLSEQANRAKTRFLATISHEIRTPMNGIMGMTDLLAESELSADQRTYCRAISKSATTLLSLIDEILDYAKIEAGKFEAAHEPYDPTELAEGVIELLAPRAFDKGLSIGCYVSPDLPQQVMGDEPRMRQILLNLVGNAIKFTEQGGIALEISATDKGERLRFAVIDTGIGLSKEDMDRIFVELEQVDDSMTRRNGGTGLGLAISRRLVGKLGGEIAVSSQRQKGSTFTVDMPLVRAGETAPLRERLRRPQGIGSVLVACDHEVEGRLVGKMLKSTGLEVAVKDRRLALDLLQNGSGEGFEAVITDAVEAPLYAADLLRAAQVKLGRPVKGLMLIESTDRRDYEAMRGRGYNAYVTRPVRHESLLKQLETVPARSVIAEPESAAGQFTPQPVTRQPAMAKPAQPRPAAEPVMPPVQPVPAVAARPVSAARGKARILLAEDNDINALLGIRLLEHMGHEVTHVTDGQLALQAIKKSVGSVPFDLVLMDIHMPHMDGFTATQEIRAFEAGQGAKHKRVPIVALTANAFNEVKAECREAGMDAYLAKPFAREELQETIDSCLRGDGTRRV